MQRRGCESIVKNDIFLIYNYLIFRLHRAQKLNTFTVSQRNPGIRQRTPDSISFHPGYALCEAGRH